MKKRKNIVYSTDENFSLENDNQGVDNIDYSRFLESIFLTLFFY